MRILLAEDDELMGAAVRGGLQQQGFYVDWVQDGHAALRELLAQDYEAAVLDLGMPRMDGLEVLAKLRAQHKNTPVLVLTARDAVHSRVEGLDLGADDYVLKPVDLHELAARLRALIRRAHGLQHNVLTHGNIELDPVARSVRVSGSVVTLAQREYDLLHALMRNPNSILSRDQLEAQIYPWGNEVSSNAIEVHIYHLRRKLGNHAIQTVRGMGYTLASE